MSLPCCHCKENVTKPVMCSSCNEFACDKCTISKDGSITCVQCFLKSSNIAERKMWTEILKKKGVIKEKVEDILNYLGSPVAEFSYTNIEGKKSFIIKTKGAKGFEYNRVSDETFKSFW